MNNALTTLPNLPQHLMALASNKSLMGLNTSAAAGISAGGWPKLSLKGCRFRLQQPSQEELVVQTLYLDVILVDANPHGVSKRYYAKAWDPSQEAAAPDCYSDNGVGPSNKAASPQCGTCAACPHNVWGSKISEASGKAIKACSDLKKVAILVADNTGGPVFELDIPADSMKALADYVKSLDKHGVPVPTIITRLGFDPSVSYPKLTFAPAFSASGQLPYITEAMLADVMEVINTDEVDNCTGKNDVPVDPTRVGAAATTVIAQTPQVTAPVAQPTQAPIPTPAAILPPALPAMPSAATAPVAEAPAKRTRKPKVEASVAAVPATPPMQAPGMATPPFLQNVVPPAQQAANITTPLSAPVTNSTLDDLIAKAMGV